MMCGFSIKTGICVEKCLPKLGLSIKMGIWVEKVRVKHGFSTKTGIWVEKGGEGRKVISYICGKYDFMQRRDFLKTAGVLAVELRRRAAGS